MDYTYIFVIYVHINELKLHIIDATLDNISSKSFWKEFNHNETFKKLFEVLFLNNDKIW